MDINQLKKVQDWLYERDITEVECVIGDFGGVARGKIAPVNKFVQEKGMRLPESVLLQSITGAYVEDKLYYSLLDKSDIDFYCEPDCDAMFELPWLDERSALVIHNSYYRDGQPVNLSPRNVLKQVLSMYEEKGWTPIIAPEMEFYLTAKNNDPDYPLKPPVGSSGRYESGRQSFSIAATNEFQLLFEDMYAWCEKQGLNIDTLIHEEGTAQMEINFCHDSALLLADHVFVFKRTLREAAKKHNIVATFMAKPITNEPGSSMHIHQSIVDAAGKNIFIDAAGEKTELFFHYIGGLQQLMVHMLPLVAPNVNSFRRFLPNSSTPINTCWGYENRNCSIRIPESTLQATRAENRIAGADANSYLAIAASLLGGYIGMVERIAPTAPTEGRDDISKNDFPQTLNAALDIMQQSIILPKYIDNSFLKAYIATKRVELGEFDKVISAWEREFLLLSV